MSTRQLRITDPIEISKRIAEFIGKKIHVVFNDNTALSGKLTNANSTELVLQNMLLKKNTRPLNSVVEIYIDSLS
jgi:hypothetical protein